MKKRIFSRVLALAMALSLLSTTAFAASFTQLQDAINGNSSGTQIGNTDSYGYGNYIDGAGYEITARDSQSGREVNLWSNVEFTEGDKGIVIDGSKEGQKNVTINMNGNTIDMNPDAVLDAKAEGYGKFYQATTDADGNKVAVTGETGEKIEAENLNSGRVLEVKNGAVVTVNGKGGTVTGGNIGTITVRDDGDLAQSRGTAYAGAGVQVTGNNSIVTMTDVNISGNRGTYWAGGVYAGKGSTFNMTDGSITNNYSVEHGGGIGASETKEFNLNNVNLLSNATHHHGGGIWLYKVDTATITGGTIIGNHANTQSGGGINARNVENLSIENTQITNNTAAWFGGGIYSCDKSTLDLKGNTQITGNTASAGVNWAGGGGVYACGPLTVTGKEVEIYGNTAAGHSADLYLDRGVSFEGLSLLNQRTLKDEDGHTLNGWYKDADGLRWEEGKVSTLVELLDGVSEGEYNLKFAHNKFYDIKVDLNDGSEDANTTVNAEVGFEDHYEDLAKFTEPTRTGYTFTGWSVDGSNELVQDISKLASDKGDDITVTAQWEINKYTANFDSNGGSNVDPSEVEYNTPFNRPENPTRDGYTFDGWTLPDGTPYDFTTPATENVELVAKWTPVDDDDDDNTGDTTPDATLPAEGLPAGGADAATTTIEDEETPLAGLFTRADAIGYLWEQTGSPEAELSDFPDVPEDHYWATAIGWAQDMGIALPDEEGNFRPDDLVLLTSDEPEGELQEFLNRYAVFAGIELEDGELFIELEADDDGIIMGEEAQVIFDQFFAKLEAALAEQAA